MEKRLQSRRWQTPISHKRGTVVTVHKRCHQNTGPTTCLPFCLPPPLILRNPSDCRCQYQCRYSLLTSIGRYAEPLGFLFFDITSLSRHLSQAALAFL